MTAGTPLPAPHSGTPGIAWPALAGGVAPLLLATIQQLEHSQYLEAGSLRALQFLQAGQLLTHVTAHVPFYKDALGGSGWTPGQALSQEQWDRLPILTRPMLQEAGAALHCGQVPPEHGAITTTATSGSTGRPITVRTTALSQFFWSAFTLREELWHRRDMSAKFATIRHSDQRPDGHLGPFAKAFESWGAPVATIYPTGPAVLLDVRCSVADQVAWLVREAPGTLLTFATTLGALAAYCLEHRIQLPSLRSVRSSGEVLTPHVREACRQAWGIEPADMYSAVEAGYLALQCREAGQLHIQAESALVEVLDNDGRPCRPGEIGRVVVTPLHNFAMPLLRYEIGDLAEVGGPCACGRTLPVLRRVLGRTRDQVMMPSGEKRLYYASRRQALPGILQHQLVQTSLHAMTLRIVARQPFAAEEEARLRHNILSDLGGVFDIEIIYVDEIERSASGKFMEFKSSVPAEHNSDVHFPQLLPGRE